MKVRFGFVSNSSSSSFCVYGTYIDENVYYEKYEEFKDIMNENYIETHGNPYDYDNTTMVGRAYSTLKDDETGGEFKRKTEEAMKKIFGDDIKLSYHEAGWYDG